MLELGVPATVNASTPPVPARNRDDGARGEEIAGTIHAPGILHVGFTRSSSSEEPRLSIDTRESSRTCGQPADLTVLLAGGTARSGG